VTSPVPVSLSSGLSEGLKNLLDRAMVSQDIVEDKLTVEEMETARSNIEVLPCRERY